MLCYTFLFVSFVIYCVVFSVCLLYVVLFVLCVVFVYYTLHCNFGEVYLFVWLCLFVC